jgi:transcriptional regulator with XRE-family HTH domain
MMKNLADLTDSLSKRIRDRRGELHLSQREAADLLGVSVRTLQNWEAGGSFPWPRHRRVIETFLNGEVAA